MKNTTAMEKTITTNGLEIAVVGMSVNLCGCDDVAAFWQSLLAGDELLSTLDEAALRKANVDPSVSQQENYVPVASEITDRFDFDPAFFGYSARDAEFMDPQLRLAHQCVFQALQQVGIAKRDRKEVTGLYFGASFNIAWLQYVSQVCSGNLLELHDLRTLFQNEFFASRIANKLNLSGPALNVSATCATSSVAIHLAAQGLLSGDCDVALAGAACISPDVQGYQYFQNMIQSSDGHCRVFDDKADGTIFGNGVGVVALKRLDDAIADGNHIYAVLKGSALNNDGDDKASYTAPSVQGQREVIWSALNAAQIGQNEVDFVECHGTATRLGDPIEIEALKQSYGHDNAEPVLLGSVKSNLGHLDTAAGVVGFIKATLALQHHTLPKTLHFSQLNRHIDLAGSNLAINAQTSRLPEVPRPLRAGVSSFGIGGTNAHLIVEEYIEQRQWQPSRKRWQLLPFSAHSQAALANGRAALLAHLSQASTLNELPDFPELAFTIQRRDVAFPYRQSLVAQSVSESLPLLTQLEQSPPSFANLKPQMAFLFPGQGSQYLGMAASLYQFDALFAAQVDQCFDLLPAEMAHSLRPLFLSQHADDRPKISATQYAQPLLFIVEYALAKHVMQCGIEPTCMLGHSLGEYVAACLAGVFSLQDALYLVCQRGALMSQAQPGLMLSVAAAPSKYQHLLDNAAAAVSCAAMNSQNLHVYSGTEAAISALKQELDEMHISCQLLHTSHAYHCSLMDEVLPAFRAALAKVVLNAPEMPFYSNVTGQVITAEQATSVEYWVTHLRQPVNFNQAIAHILAEGVAVLIEVGPGQTLSTFVQDNASYTARHQCVKTLPHPRDNTDSELFFVRALSSLYNLGAEVNWAYYQSDAQIKEIELPPYQFDRQCYDQVPRSAQGQAATSPKQSAAMAELGQASEQMRMNDTPAASFKIMHARPKLSTAFVAPADDVQAQLAGFWQEVFALDQIGIEDNFFELGGHSLLAIRLLNYIELSYAKTLTLNQMFAHPTIAQLASLLSETTAQAGREDITSVARDKPLALSFPQQRMWFIDQWQGQSANYNLPLPLLVEGNFDIQRAQACLNLIIARHEVLRTRYVSAPSGAVQLIDEHAEIAIKVIDLQSCSAAEKLEQAQQLAQEDALRPYDLSRDLMLRASWLVLEQQRGLLLFNMHHIASDGWSFRVLMREFMTLYAASGAPTAELLAPLPVQYADFAAWQRNQLDFANATRLSDFWCQTLADAPAVHSLPLQARRTGNAQVSGARVQRLLDISKFSAVQDMAKQYEMTPFMLIHAALSVVLARFSHSTDIVIGTPVANRTHQKTEALIGYFVNTLVLRCQYDGKATLADYLAQIKGINFSAQAHQEMPYEKLIDALKLERTGEYLPLVQIMLSVDTNQQIEGQLDGLRVTEYALDVAQPQFELDIFAKFTPAGLVFDWIYDSALFSADLINQLGNALLQVLEQFLQPSVTQISQFAVLTQAEQQQIMQFSQGPTLEFARDKLIHEFFDEQVARQGEACALVFREQQLSYQQLAEQVDQHVHWLRQRDMTPDTVIGVYMERSIEMVVAMMAIVKAGAAYVPLDPDHPPGRLAVVIEEAGIDLVLTQQHLANRFDAIDFSAKPCSFVALDAPQHRAHMQTFAGPVTTRLAGHHSRNLAYVIYTSGSTGKPKGVMVEHQALINRLEWLQNDYTLKSGERVLQKTPFGFDVSVWEFFWPLCFGGTLVVAEPNLHKDPLALSQLIAREKIAILHFVPSMLNAFLSFEELALPACTRLLFCSGEALNISDVRTLQQRSPHLAIHNLYGPTEAAIDVSYFDCQHIERYRAVPIGKPLQNVSLYVLDPQRNLTPIGTPGELYIAGVCLARGYLNREQLTSEVFIEHQFEDGQRCRMYKTGDLCRYLPDGEIEYLGRIDHQVKLRGLRIELGEIEAHLNKQENVDSCLVTVTTHGAGPALIAYVKPVVFSEDETEQQQFCEHLRTQLGDSLPKYMVPERIILLKTWPQTANGKIDRKNLPQVEAGSSATYVAARSENEQVLLEIWAELLKIDSRKLSIDANFFELGGDSITCIQVVSRAAKAGLHFKIRDMYSASTVRTLAALARQGLGVRASQEAVTGETALLPIAQQFFSNLSDWHYFNQSVLLSTPLEFELDVLRQMLQGLFQRHDALRLRFIETANGFEGQYQPWSDELLERMMHVVAWDKADFSELQVHAAPFQASLDPANGLNLKAIYFQPPAGTAQQGRLLLIIHHLVVDGISWRILLEDLGMMWQQHLASEALTLPEKSSSFSQWTQFMSEYAHSEQVQGETQYWLNQATADVASLQGVAAAASHVSEANAQRIEIQLDQQQTQHLLTDCHRVFNTKINQLLLSALLIALQRWGQLSAVKLDLEGHGREQLSDQLDISQTVGWFTSMFPLVLHNPGGTLSDVIQAVKEQYAQIPQQGIGFGLLKYLAKAPAFATTAPAELLFNYLGQFNDQFNGHHETEGQFGLATEEVGATTSPRRQADQPLSMNGMVHDGVLKFALNFPPALYAAEKMAALMQEFHACLLEIVQFAATTQQQYLSVSDFPLAKITQTELNQWSRDYPGIIDIYPATGMQQGLLFHSMLEPGAYVIQLSIELKDVNCQAFRQAWQLLCQTKDIFRTRFVGLASGNMHQLVQQHVELPWDEEDLSALDAQQQAARIAQCLKEIKPSFDLSQNPLMAIRMVKLDERRHRLIWSWHHAIIDGWCIPIILTELTDYYQQLVKQQEPALFEMPPFRNYIQWLSTQDHQQAAAFWQAQLQSVAAATPLPLFDDHAANNEALKHGICTAHLIMNDQQMQSLRTLAQSCQVTINVLFQAAWGLMLSQFSYESTVVFGGTTSGRPAQLKGVERMIGLFINSLPMVLEVVPEMPLKTWLQQVQQRIIDTEEYNYLPLSVIQQQSSVKGSLFDSLIVFENYPVNEHLLEQVSAAGLEVSKVELDEVNNYKLSLKINTAGNYHIQFTGRDGYSSSALQTLAQYFQHILYSMAQRPLQAKCRDVQMLPADAINLYQQQSAIASPDWLGSERFVNVAQAFADYAHSHPEATALVFEQQRYSYRQVNEKANQLAAHLIACGGSGSASTGPGVAIWLERGMWNYVAILAVLKTGTAYIPIDAATPTGRLAAILEQAQTKLLISSTALLARLPETNEGMSNVQHVCVDQADTLTQLQTYSPANPSLSISAANAAQRPCYIIFTSGSTGTPKGVVISHFNLWSYLQSIRHRHDIKPGLSYALMTSTSTDLGNTVLFLAMSRGGCLHVLSETEIRDANFFAQYNQQHKIDVIKMTPSHFHALYTDEVIAAQQHSRVFLGGEKIDAAVLRQLKKLQQRSGALAINHYGPTETTVGCFSGEIDLSTVDEQSTRVIAIGRPLDNAKALVLSPSLQPVPVGVTGQLFVGGLGVGMGYLHSPEQTAAAFTANPLAEHEAGLWYKTGDLVRYLPDGTVEFLGRADHQLKLRGYRIELAEIEYKLAALKQVDSCQVLVFGAPLQRLVAYVRLHDGDVADIGSVLSAQLASELPSYMIPSEFIVLEQWPLMSNGKVDRKALPQPQLSQRAYLAPQNEIENQLVDICAALLGTDRDQLSMSASFFELGGHSLLLIRLLNEISSQFGIVAEVAVVFTMRDLTQLAKYIETSVGLKQMSAESEEAETDDSGWL